MLVTICKRLLARSVAGTAKKRTRKQANCVELGRAPPFSYPCYVGMLWIRLSSMIHIIVLWIFVVLSHAHTDASNLLCTQTNAIPCFDPLSQPLISSDSVCSCLIDDIFSISTVTRWGSSSTPKTFRNDLPSARLELNAAFFSDNRLVDWSWAVRERHVSGSETASTSCW